MEVQLSEHTSSSNVAEKRNILEMGYKPNIGLSWDVCITLL